MILAGACGPGTHRAREVANPTPTVAAFVAAPDSGLSGLWVIGQMYVPPTPVHDLERPPDPRPVVSSARLALPAVQLVAGYPWPVDQAIRVMMCESSGDANAVNGPNQGLFQINAAVHQDRVAPGESLYDPVVNVRVAYAIWQDQGWRPWSCRP